jgi:hypothetical protein
LLRFWGLAVGILFFKTPPIFWFRFPHDTLWMNMMVKQNLRKICTLFLRQWGFVTTLCKFNNRDQPKVSLRCYGTPWVLVLLRLGFWNAPQDSHN